MSRSDPHPRIDELAPRLLHDLADDTERAELARLLAESPENRRRFLEHTGLHGMLAAEAKAGAFAECPGTFFRQLENPPARSSNPLVKIWLPAAAAVLVACLAILMLLPATAAAALDRVMSAMNEARDRTYRIEVIEHGPGGVTSRPDRGRFPPANHLDGATLWLRGPGEFVLNQSLPNGENRMVGADGSMSWSMRGDGPVRVSGDPERFGRAIFDTSGDIAFLDPRTQLEALKRLYEIDWLDRDSPDTWKLRGFRRSDEQGGPREIEIWFHPESGLLERMILRELPRGSGGPRGIAIILQSTEPLPSDFFNHSRHHDEERTIQMEP